MDGLKAKLSFDAVAYDYDDEYLTIDTDTHTININNVSRLFGVQYDGNSKLIKFRIKNTLSDIQKMQDSIVYINWIDSRGVKGQSIAINKTINNDTCEFAWKVPFDALKNSGVLHFAMSAVVTKNSSTVIDQRWSTKIASVITPDGIYIKSYTPSSEEEDRIAQIYNELSNMINKQNDNLQSQVNSLKEDLGDLEKGIGVYEYISPNMFNKDTVTLNKTINGNGDIVDDPNNKYCASDYVDVSGHNSIVLGFYNVGKWNTLNTYIVAFDGEKNVIGKRGLTETLYSVPTNAKYIRVAFNSAYIDYAMIVDGGFQVDKYYPYDHYIDYLKGINELINTAVPNVYYVGKNRTDKSFSAVVTEAVKYKNSIVYVDDGEYDIETEFKAIYGDNFFSNFERSGRRGLYLGNGIKIIMSSNTIIKFHYSGDNANVKELFSPFNFAPYSEYSSKDYEINGFELRGGIIDVKNARYCSHDDPSSFDKPYINKYINVQMKLDNTENTVWGAHNCIGAGLGKFGEFNVESCIFETVGSKDTTASISIHNTSQPNAKSFISIRDNYLYGNNTIRLLYYGTSQLKTKAIVCGNSVSRQIELKPNTSDSTIENIELVAWNNEIRNN